MQEQSTNLSPIESNQSLEINCIDTGQQSMQKNLRTMHFFPIPQQQNQFQAIIVKRQGDLRRKCLTPNQLPYSAIGVIYVLFKQFGYCGTAFMIRNNVAMTAAHILVYQNLKPVQIILCLNELNGIKKQYYKVIKYFFPQRYKKNRNKQDDYAIVVLDEGQNIGQKHGTIALSSEQIQQNIQIEIFGYPKDLNNQNNQMFLFGCKNIIKKVQDKKIFHIVDTNPGQSGSPILRFNSTKQTYEVIGVHVSGGNNLNLGVRITKAVTLDISKWIKDAIQNHQNQMSWHNYDYWQQVQVAPLLQDENYIFFKVDQEQAKKVSLALCSLGLIYVSRNWLKNAILKSKNFLFG